MGGTADELTKGCKKCMVAYIVFVLVVVATICYIGIRAQRKLKAIAAADDDENQRQLMKQVMLRITYYSSTGAKIRAKTLRVTQ